MPPRWLTALLVLPHEAWSVRRDAHIRFLKLQVEMLKSRLPGNRVSLAPVALPAIEVTFLNEAAYNETVGVIAECRRV